ncbi:MAG TPA: hypothetical protein VM470_05295 [Acidimicrobiia bacterium]|nr:hypothetical protein [Acidimicrobiia bacterium]
MADPLDPYTRSFGEPDEVIALARLRSEVLVLGGMAVAHNIHGPGWHWSKDVGPVVRTSSCQTRHVGVALNGQIHVVLDSGFEFEVRAGDLFEIPPGHDSWVVGDAPCETIEWSGARSWIHPLETLSERVLASLVLTDIVDSTAVASRIGDRAFSDLIATHHERVRDTLGRFRGKEIRFTGDGVLAMFDGAARAVLCASALLRVGDGLGLKTRAAVHTGEVDTWEEEVRGLALHEVARIITLAAADEVLVSANTRELLKDSGLHLEERGLHQLKGLSGPRLIYAYVGASDVPPAMTQQA